MELGGGNELRGTGYLVADRVVLTARHLVVDGNGVPGEVQVQGVSSSESASAKVVWLPADTTVDVALLEVMAPPARLKSVYWGRIGGGHPRKVSGVGFPRRQGRGTGGLRHSEHLWGVVTLQPRHRVFSVDVGSPTHRPPDARDAQSEVGQWATPQWSGASGTALFCGPYLVGVLSSDANAHTYDGKRLHAVPVSAWWDDPEFVIQRKRLGLDTHVYPVPDPTADAATAGAAITRTPAEEELCVAMARQIDEFTAGWHGVREEADKAIDVQCHAVQGEEFAHAAQAIPITHDTIHEYFLALSPRRLIITGRSGSGKTVLALRLMRQLLDMPGLPVPVYFNLAAWEAAPARIRLLPYDARPKKLAEHFEAWLARQLIEQDLVLSPRTARKMVRDRRILPVLDGLDQIPPEVMSNAGGTAGEVDVLEDLVWALNSYRDLDGGSRGPLVLATQPRKDSDTETRDIPLPEGAVVQVERLTWQQIQEHLGSEQGPRDLRTDLPVDWQPVLDDLARHRDRAVAARRLDTPWKLTLAEWAAASGRVTPQALITDDTNDEAVEEALLASFVPSVHGYHSVHTSGTSGSSPEQVEGWLTVLARHLERNRGTVRGVRLSGREVVLARMWPVAGTRRVRIAHLFVHLVPLCFFGLACLIAAVSGPGHTGDFSSSLLHGDFPALTDVTRRRLVGALVLTSLLLLAGGYFALRFWPWMPPTHWPMLAFAQRRTQGLRTRHGPRRLLSGLEIGCAIGLGVGMGCTLAFGWVPGLVTGAVFAVLFGWVMEGKVGLDRTLSGNFNPEFFWALDTLSAAVFAGIGAAVFPLLDYSWTSGLAFGGCFGFVLGFGFGLVPWLRYTTAMTLARKELPWRLAAFLDWARQSGLMTISGVGFQFRHQELQEWIAKDKHASTTA